MREHFLAPITREIAISIHQPLCLCETAHLPHASMESELPLTPHVGRDIIITKPLQSLTTMVKKMHYFMIIQGSSCNGKFEWINSNKYKNLYITFMTVLFTPNQVMFNNLDSTNVVTNSNDEKLMIPPGYYTITEIIAILNTMTNTTFLISTKASSYGCIYIQYPHTIDFINAPDNREILGLEGQMIILPASFYGSNVISREIVKWSKCTRLSCVPPIWGLPTRTTICSPQWSLMIPRLITSAPWKTFALRW